MSIWTRLLQWATNAVQGCPDDADFLDTLAEVHFHLHHYDQAIQCETAALKLEPGDKIMSRQLKKFQAATTAPSTRP